MRRTQKISDAPGVAVPPNKAAAQPLDTILVIINHVEQQFDGKHHEKRVSAFRYTHEIQ